MSMRTAPREMDRRRGLFAVPSITSRQDLEMASKHESTSHCNFLWIKF
jgi:hypothetical protein